MYHHQASEKPGQLQDIKRSLVAPAGSAKQNAAVVAPVKAGDILADKYCVERILGIGGMGVVVAADHIALHQKVALKFMLPEALANEGAVERFMREARAAVRLRSENVARVMDVGCLDSGAPYIVMEFLEGEDLSDVVHREGRMTVPVAIDLILQACLAMAEAHSLGIVHRDLKPANLFITKRPDGTALVKVLDFGISKVQDDADEKHKTKSSMAMGSPGYMAPEQMRSAKHADHRADIWALGVILYLLLANRRPFEAPSPPLMFAAVLTGDITLLSSLVPDIDPALEEAIHHCLERDREARFSSVAELAQALAPFGDEKAAGMAASIANVSVATPLAAQESGANARATVPMRNEKPPEESSREGLPATKIANSMSGESRPRMDKKVLTTHRASAGQVVVAAPDTDDYNPISPSRLPLIGGLAAVAVLALVATRVFTGSADSVTPTGAVLPPVESLVEVPPATIDAGVADAVPTAMITAVDAAPADAKPKPATVKPRPRPRPPKDPKPKPAPKPKPKPNDDPFGTMQ
jgi:serine/threonine-protein kinase